jgi:uncharacterized protein YndB with AHSA1/START domain
MTEAAMKTATQDIVVEEPLRHPPEAIWKTLTTGALIDRWLLEVTRNERPSYSWRGGHDDNAHYGSRLDTIVTWTLTKVDGGTRLRLVHSGKAPKPNRQGERGPHQPKEKYMTDQDRST